MELQGSYQFKAPVEKVWDALLDPKILSMALPGGDQLEKVGENDYKAAMQVKVGPVQGRFEGQVTLSDIVKHESYRMKVNGSGAPGFVNGEGSLKLTPNDEGTLLTYSGDVQVGGRIAAVGQRLIDSTAKSIIRQGLKTLDEQILGVGAAPKAPAAGRATTTTAPSPSAETSQATAPASSASPESFTSSPSPSPAATTSSSTTYSAATDSSPELGKMAVGVVKDIAQDLASDFIPREKQGQVFSFILGALAMLLFVVLVRLVQRD